MTLPKLAVILIFIAIAGPLVWSFRPFSDSDFIVSAAAFSIGVTTFFGVTELNRSAEGSKLFSDENLRTAIASALVLTYLFLVCFNAFVKTQSQAGEVTKEFIQSFSQVIAVTIAFYFGATAATQIFAKRKDNEQEARRDENK